MKNLIFIAGGSSNIGAAVARAAVGKYRFILSTYLNSKEKSNKQLQSLSNDGTLALHQQMDVTNPKSISENFLTAVQEYGQIDTVVNCFGTQGGRVQLCDQSIESIYDEVSVNLLGTVFCCRQAIQCMRSQNSGTIINISSLAAKTGGFNISTYASAKAGVEALTIALSKEVGGSGIRVNAVSPGTISPDSKDMADKNILDKIPLGYAGEPSDVANTVIWLASDQASYITGAIINVNGGRRV